MNKLLLFLVLLPKVIWRKLGADVHQLQAILRVKLLFDDRRPIVQGKVTEANPGKKGFKFKTALSMFVSAVMGMMYGMSLFMKDIVFGMWIYFSTFLIMLCVILITDFSTVLFDSKDKYVLLTKPVNAATILLSKLLHMFIYLIRIVLPMSLAGWIFLYMELGWKVHLWFPFVIILLTFLALFVVNSCYLLVLKFIKVERFKDVINYFQILASILFFSCIYFMPRVVDGAGFEKLTHLNFPVIQYTPTYWLVCTGAMAHLFKVGWSFYVLWGVLGIILPILLVWLTVKYLSPSFVAKFSDIDQLSTTEKEVSKSLNKQKKTVDLFYNKLSQILNRNSLGRAGFELTWLYTSRSRTFKMRVYPMFAYVPVYFVFLMTQNGGSIAEMWENLPQGKSYLMLLYLPSFVVMSVLSYSCYSESFKAAWVYNSSPTSNPGMLMGGALKAVYTKYILPVFGIIAIFVISIWGFSKCFDIALALINITIFALLLAFTSYRYLPFSQSEQMAQKGGSIFKTLFAMLIPILLGLMHYTTTVTLILWWLKLLFAILGSIFCWMIWDSYSKTSWKEIKNK
jgi:ABC-2 type transport system permease protein